MPRKIAAKPRRDDWAPGEPVQLTDGREAIKWHNIVTGEEATLLEGQHPFDNRNAASLPVAVLDNGAEIDDDDDAQFEEEDPADKVATLMRSFTGEGRAEVKIWRVKSDGSESYCGSPTAENFLQGGYEMIRTEYGPGKYKCILYATNPVTGKFARRGTQVVEIEAGPKREATAAPQVDVSKAVADALAPILERLAPQAPPKSAAEQMTEMLTMMKLAREAFAPPAAPPPPSPADSIKEILALMNGAKQLREAIEEPDKGDPLIDMAGKALDLISSNRTPQPNPAEPLPLIQTATIPIQPAQPMPEMSPEENEAMLQLQFAISILNARAAKNADIEESAEQVYEHAPDELIDLLHVDQWFSELVKLAPQIAPHQAWYERVRARVLEMLKEDEEPDIPADAPAKPAKPVTVKGADNL